MLDTSLGIVMEKFIAQSPGYPFVHGALWERVLTWMDTIVDLL